MVEEEHGRLEEKTGMSVQERFGNWNNVQSRPIPVRLIEVGRDLPGSEARTWSPGGEERYVRMRPIQYPERKSKLTNPHHLLV